MAHVHGAACAAGACGIGEKGGPFELPAAKATKKRKRERPKCTATENGKQCTNKRVWGGMKGKCRMHGGGARCQHEECKENDRIKPGGGGNSARAGMPFCAAHGGGKRCQHEECKEKDRVEPGSGNVALGGTLFCIAHGGGKRCQHEECKDKDRVEPGSGNAAQGSTPFCRAHGGGARCQHKECKDKDRVEPGSGNSAANGTPFCIAHGGGKRCQHEECKEKDCIKPGSGNSAEKGTSFCIAHGGGKRCQHEECKEKDRIKPGAGNSAVGGTPFCNAHGGGKRCQHEECKDKDRVEPGSGNSARGGTPFCIAHGGGQRCPICIDYIDSRSGSPKYDGHCATCFKRAFPNDPRSTVVYAHTKEIRVRNFINARYDGFVHDRPMWIAGCDCTQKRRVDHRKLIGGVMLAVETDEFAHRSYDKRDEEVRYDDLVSYHTGPWVFIRFNPDDCLSGKGVDMEDKLARLGDEMDEHIERIERGLVDASAGLVEIYKLFY